MAKRPRTKSRHPVLATAAPIDDRVRILKYGTTIAVFNRFGDVESDSFGQLGVFHKETRHLSRWTVQLNSAQPLLLSSIIHDDNSFLSVDLTNPDMSLESGSVLRRETIHLFRSKFVFEDACHEELRLTSYGTAAIRMTLSIFFEADFADIFEVRGSKRAQKGRRLADQVEQDRLVLSYMGLDRVERSTVLTFNPPPARLEAHLAQYELDLQPKRDLLLFVSASFHQRDAVSTPISYGDGFARLRERIVINRSEWSRVTASDAGYNTWFSRSLDDLRLLTVGNPEGPYPYAGVPWFNTIFGRDGIITALEMLWIVPAMAEAVLLQLGASQATAEDAERDAEPGKILHEMRRGEMAATREVPFGCYYGSVDATPLYVLLAGAYLSRTGNIEFVRRIWPHVKSALKWMDRYGDCDGDGFIEYSRQSDTGLVQQGWKDSNDSVFHGDGTLASPPIALCEVQAYAFAAKRLAARIARQLEEQDFADHLEADAESLRRRFEEQFWDEELGTYAMALDGNKRKCRVRSSNAGQALFTGIASAERVQQVRDQLMDGRMYSGWGIRTLSADEVRYNPMSYHNGSVWPHDNALIALGFSRYGYQKDAARVMRDMQDASSFMELRRMPELFCGLHKRNDGTGPTMYPVACSPQAWSAGAAFSFLQAALGLTVQAERPQLHFANPQLPDGLDDLWIHNLRFGDAAAAIHVRRSATGVAIETDEVQGDVQVQRTP